MKNSFVSSGRLVAVLAGAIALASSPAMAATIYSAGAGGVLYDWTSTTATWSSTAPPTFTATNVPTSADDVVLSGPGTAAKVTFKLVTAQAINSLTFNTSDKFYIGVLDNQANTTENPPKTLTITSGNISTTSGAVIQQYSSIRSTIAIPDNVNATWDFGISNSQDIGIADVTAGSTVSITKNGTKGISVSGPDNASNLHAAWNITSGNLTLGAAGALGTGPVSYSGSNLNITASGIQANNWNFAGTISFNTNTTATGTTTFTGNITGSGLLDKSGNGTGAGALILAGTNNTYSGNINHPRGVMAMDGTFTGLGNIAMTTNNNSEQDVLVGVGTVGMAAKATITVTGYNAAHFSVVSPGRDGTIGTLTVGTALNTGANSNIVQLNKFARLDIDVDASTSDLLTINGNLVLNGSGVAPTTPNALYINGTLGSTTNYTLATYNSLAGTFTTVFYNGADVTTTAGNVDGFDGFHQLVYGANSLTLVTVGAPIPEPASLALLAVGGLALIRRRRR